MRLHHSSRFVCFLFSLVFSCLKSSLLPGQISLPINKWQEELTWLTCLLFSGWTGLMRPISRVCRDYTGVRGHIQRASAVLCRFCLSCLTLYSWNRLPRQWWLSNDSWFCPLIITRGAGTLVCPNATPDKAPLWWTRPISRKRAQLLRLELFKFLIPRTPSNVIIFLLQGTPFP